MKILMVSDTYYPWIGGIPDHIFYLSRALRKRGHRVKVLTSRLGDVRKDEEIVRVGKGILIRSNKSFARLTIGWRPSDKVKKLCYEYSPDVVHLHGSLAPMLPILAIRHSKSINVQTFHAGLSKSTGYMIFKSLLMPYFRKLNGIIAVSETAKLSMGKYFPADYRIIPNGVDTEEFSPRIEPLPQFSDKRKKILFMNRLEPKKGLPHLLRALRRVKREIPDVLLIVAGSGPFAQYYKNQVNGAISENVVFVGEVPARPGTLRASYYRSCDLFCAPSIGHESFGIVLLEAMACGKPVVASNIEGYRTVLTDREEGLFFLPKDDTGMAKAISEILKNSELANKMGEAGRKKALSYSWPKIAEEVERFYFDLKEKRI